ncbi:LmbU family transcriptional regulator [Kibdelosporangium aridum]|nr:LmbU family transcriptional regulator [Kibdelosporangium aridum]
MARTQRTSLQLPPGIPIEMWQRLGQQLHRITNSSCWWLGDWLLYGEDTYPGRYREAVARTALDYQTLRNYAWVARAFELSRRRDNLSFQHHAEVAALSVTEQDMWLTRAVEFGWSRGKLRDMLRAHRNAGKQIEAGREVVDVRVTIASERHQRWKRAAEQAGMQLHDWIARRLDEAAR